MKKLTFSTLILFLVFSATFAQKPEGIIMEASVVPIIDGQIDVVWAEANNYIIRKNFQTEQPTLSAEWKALWTADGIYIYVGGHDDEFYPYYLADNPTNVGITTKLISILM
ncbi:MAG: hypothetical protein IPF54_14520 [Draconibacterium sp.]|nr:hypothetical protein [Draconibacterium sp.]